MIEIYIISTGVTNCWEKNVKVIKLTLHMTSLKRNGFFTRKKIKIEHNVWRFWLNHNVKSLMSANMQVKLYYNIVLYKY